MVNIILATTSIYYYKKCKCNQAVENLPFIKCKILASNAQNIQVSVEGEWRFVLIYMPAKYFLELEKKYQIKLISQLRLRGKFSLTPTFT